LALEGNRAGREIDEPDPRRHFADLLAGGVVIGEQAIMPEFARALVMLAPGFDVVNLKAVQLQIGDGAADIIEFAAGKI